MRTAYDGPEPRGRRRWSMGVPPMPRGLWGRAALTQLALVPHGKNEINTAYGLGGAPLLRHTVEQATGLRLDHYAEVDFLGFVDVFDSLGGVTVCVPEGGLRDEKAGADFSTTGPASESRRPWGCG